MRAVRGHRDHARGDVVHSALGARFQPAQEWNAPWEDVESGDETPVYDLQELLDGELGLCEAVDEDLYHEIEASFGDDTMWMTRHQYDLRQRDADLLGWAEFRSLIMHKSRYMQLDEQSFVAQMYGVPSPRRMLKRVVRLIDRHRLYRVLAPGDVLWRGRTHDVPSPAWGPAELASAPDRLARQSRMSAAGISVFYGAFDVDTVAAELADERRPWLLAGAFTPTRPLKMIDLTRVPPVPSPFSEHAARKEDRVSFSRHGRCYSSSRHSSCEPAGRMRYASQLIQRT